MGTRVSLGWGTPLDGILSGRICSAQQQISAERSLLLTPAPSRPALARTRAVGVGVIQFPRVGLGRCVPRLGAGVEHLSSASARSWLPNRPCPRNPTGPARSSILG